MRDLVFLFDVDNTLLDNDHVQADLRAYLAENHGADACHRYWELFEELRATLGYADYFGALQRYRLEALHNPRLLRMANWLVEYPFADRLFPSAVEAVKRAQDWGAAVILSDGDAALQPRKVERSGLWKLFGDNVLIYVHKEMELDDVERFYPAAHYVLVDDKLRIHAAVKKLWEDRVTTVFVRQGHYAHDPEYMRDLPPADLTIETIAGFLALNREAFTR